jgi:predicted rRNA methylase YqxC with S4 and FtsJ domains
MEVISNQNETNMLRLRVANTIWISRATYMLAEILADLGEVVIQHEQNINQNDSGSSTCTYLQVAVERAAAGRKRYGPVCILK